MLALAQKSHMWIESAFKHPKKTTQEFTIFEKKLPKMMLRGSSFLQKFRAVSIKGVPKSLYAL